LQDRVLEAVAVPLGRELSVELRNEQPTMREDQDAERARRFDETRRGDRLARRGRVAEPVAPARTGILACVLRRELKLVVGLLEVDAEIVFLLLGLGGGLLVAVSVAVQLRLDLRRGDQLGEHPGERVDLVAAKLGSGRKPWRALAEHALEAEHERIADLPLVGRLARARLDLGQRVVERASARRVWRKRNSRILIRMEKGLTGPGFGSEGGGSEAGRSLQRQRWLL